MSDLLLAWVPTVGTGIAIGLLLALGIVKAPLQRVLIVLAALLSVACGGGGGGGSGGGGEPTDPSAVTIAVSPKNFWITVGEELTIGAFATVDGVAVSDLDWSSDNPAVAGVQDGTVVGVSVGQTTIWVSPAGHGSQREPSIVNVAGSRTQTPILALGSDHSRLTRYSWEGGDGTPPAFLDFLRAGAASDNPIFFDGMAATPGGGVYLLKSSLSGYDIWFADLLNEAAVLRKSIPHNPLGGGRMLNLAIDPQGRLYITDMGTIADRTIRRYDPSTGSLTFFADDPAHIAIGLEVDDAGNVYVLDGLSGTLVYKIAAAGGAGIPRVLNPAGANAAGGMALSRDGATIFVADTTNSVIYRDAGGETKTCAAGIKAWGLCWTGSVLFAGHPAMNEIVKFVDLTGDNDFLDAGEKSTWALPGTFGSSGTTDLLDRLDPW